jgi:hypothetical protein
MSSLNDICHRALEETEEYRVGIKTDVAFGAAWSRVRTDPEALEHAAMIGVRQKLKEIGTTVLRSVKRAASSVPSASRSERFEQLDFFEAWGLKPRYALDDEGRKLVYTGWLTLRDFLQIIKVRKTGVARDIEHIDVLERVLETLGPLWRANPHLTFDEVALLHREAA